MTIFDMLQQSAVLTVLGMAVVFAFLWIMVICVGTMGKIFQKAEQKNEQAKLDAVQVQGVNEAVNPAVIAAISAAIAEYQKRE